MRLTDHMREALVRASKEDGLRRIDDNEPGRPPWPAPHQTLERARIKTPRYRGQFAISPLRLNNEQGSTIDQPQPS